MKKRLPPIVYDALRVLVPVAVLYLVQSQLYKLPHFFLWLFPLALFTVVVLIGGFVLLAGLMIFGIFKQYEWSSQPLPPPVDVSGENAEPPEGARSLVADLLANGFTRFGRSRLTVPDEGVAYTTEYLIDEARLTIANVIWGQPLLQRAALATVFEDETLLTTTYAGADASRLSDEYFSFYAENLAEAIAAHRQHVNEMHHQHGPPILFESFAERIAYFTKAGPRYRLNDAQIFDKDSRKFLLSTGGSVLINLVIMGAGALAPIIVLVGGFFAWLTSVKMWRAIFQLLGFYWRRIRFTMQKSSRS